METIAPKIRFDKSGYYFIGLMALAFLGFWRSYFSRFFAGNNDYNFYFHFHAVMMVLWVLLLIIQPLLIRKKLLPIHRIIGKISYVIMPLMLLSVLLVLNSGLKTVPANEITFRRVLFPVRDFLFLLTFFSIAVIYRRKVQIHARAMVLTGIVFIEPALFRFLGGLFGQIGAITGMLLILAIPITLIIRERKQKTARWLFPVFLIVDVIIYLVVIIPVPLSFLDPVARWFAALPLT